MGVLQSSPSLRSGSVLEFSSVVHSPLTLFTSLLKTRPSHLASSEGLRRRLGHQRQALLVIRMRLPCGRTLQAVGSSPPFPDRTSLLHTVISNPCNVGSGGSGSERTLHEAAPCWRDGPRASAVLAILCPDHLCPSCGNNRGHVHTLGGHGTPALRLVRELPPSISEIPSPETLSLLLSDLRSTAGYSDQAQPQLLGPECGAHGSEDRCWQELLHLRDLMSRVISWLADHSGSGLSSRRLSLSCALTPGS